MKKECGPTASYPKSSALSAAPCNANIVNERGGIKAEGKEVGTGS